jgi:hypothetical protein
MVLRTPQGAARNTQGAIMNRSKAVLRALVIAAALAAPLALTTAAHASTSHDGCTVDPKTPYHNGDFTASGLKRIAYEVEIDCVGAVTIEVQQERWEQDSGLSADDFIGDSTLVRYFSSASGITWTITGTLPDTDDFGDNYEEMYQRVRFRVTSGTVTGTWSGWEESAVRSIHV